MKLRSPNRCINFYVREASRKLTNLVVNGSWMFRASCHYTSSVLILISQSPSRDRTPRRAHAVIQSDKTGAAGRRSVAINLHYPDRACSLFGRLGEVVPRLLVARKIGRCDTTRQRIRVGPLSEEWR
jgi:hypothetical protein